MSETIRNVAVIIPAGGSGLRFGEPKQFKKLAHKTVLELTVQAFLNFNFVTQISISLPAEVVAPIIKDERVVFVRGGATRAESVYNGFVGLKADKTDVVLIHDAVRPFVSSKLILNVIKASQEFGVALPVLNVTDTVKSVDEFGFVLKTVARQNLRLAQTPQGFLYSILASLYAQAPKLSSMQTDEVYLAEQANTQVKTVAGEAQNIKITHPTDWLWAEYFFKAEHDNKI